MRKLVLVLIAMGMFLFGVGVLYLQIFAWHHFNVLTIFGVAMSSVGLCILYDHFYSRRRRT